MGLRKLFKNKSKLIKLTTLGLILGLVTSPLFILNSLSKDNIKEAEAADYSGVSSGFSLNSDGSISASFTVTNNDLDMRGWLLCLFENKPTVDSNNKLTNSNSAHPYSYSAAKHYFFASNTKKTGSITVTWASNAGDQKQNWTASTSTGASGKTLNDYIKNGTNWHIVIGPRHYNTSWGDSGIGEGTNGYWENCDLYVGQMSEVFPTTDKDMSVNVQSSSIGYDGQNHSIGINVTDPNSGYTIRYRTASSGSYNLTTNPTYKDAGTYRTYFQITATGYKTYEGSGTVTIQKAYPSYNAPTAKTDLVYNGEEQALVNAGSSIVLYSLDNSNYSSSVPVATDAGNYRVYYKVDATTNYEGIGPYSIDVSIAKANASYIENPTAKTGLTYTGEPQNLANPGTTTGGTVIYSLDNDIYSSEVPQALYVGEYTVYYKIDGDANYNGTEAEHFTVNINPVDKTELIEAIDLAKDYLDEISPTYPNIGYELSWSIEYAEYVKENDNRTAADVEETKQSVIDALNLAHARIVDYLIDIIGNVRYNDKCLTDIENAETAYNELEDNQKPLVEHIDKLTSARELYEKLDTVAKAINAIGEVTYDEECLERLENAKDVFNTLSKDEQNIIPTLFNELNSDEDIYEALKLIEELEETKYNKEFLNALENARHTFNALDMEEQKAIYNYQNLLDAEKEYNHVDNLVNLVNDIPSELEYVGPREDNLERARKAYEALSDEEKALVPTLTYETLNEKEEEYEELKVEHERKEIEDREAGVAIAIEGASGIPTTVAIDINKAKSNDADFKDNIDCQTIQETMTPNETISSFCEIKMYEEVEGKPVEVSLKDIDENITATITLDVPDDVNPSKMKIVLLDENNNITEVEYTFDASTRIATINTKKLGTFAIVSIEDKNVPETNGLPLAIVGVVGVTILIGGVAWFAIFKKIKIG